MAQSKEPACHLNEACVIIDTACEIGGGLLRRSCGREAVAACVYCGRAFCEEHGERGEDFADVCSRSECRGKQRDLNAHREWRLRMQAANSVSVCAREGCTERMRSPCYRCRLIFCDAHLSQRAVIDRATDPPQKLRALVCQHCHDRRKIWD